MENQAVRPAADFRSSARWMTSSVTDRKRKRCTYETVTNTKTTTEHEEDIDSDYIKREPPDAVSSTPPDWTGQIHGLRNSSSSSGSPSAEDSRHLTGEMPRTCVITTPAGLRILRLVQAAPRLRQRCAELESERQRLAAEYASVVSLQREATAELEGLKRDIWRAIDHIDEGESMVVVMGATDE